MPDKDILVKYYEIYLNFTLMKQVSYSIYAKTVESMNVGRHTLEQKHAIPYDLPPSKPSLNKKFCN